jgi:uncharacterized protein (DUF2267 family)
VSAGGKKTTRRKSRAKAPPKGWQAPDSPPPSDLLTDAYLSHARAQISGLDTDARQRQLEARRALATLYRVQLIEKERLTREVIEADAQMGDDAHWIKRQQILQQANRAVDPQLRLFFDDLSLRIWRSDDPVATAQALLYGEPARGAPSGNHDYRDFLIAAKVAHRMHRKEKREDACAAVARKLNLSPGTVLNIYKKRRNKSETKVQLNMWERQAEAEAEACFGEGTPTTAG